MPKQLFVVRELLAMEVRQRRMVVHGECVLPGSAREAEAVAKSVLADQLEAVERFILADTPGHVQYTRNMVTGVSTAELAMILVDARNGICAATDR